MKKWVISGIFAALFLTLTGALVTGEKGAIILPLDPYAELVHVNDTKSL